MVTFPQFSKTITLRVQSIDSDGNLHCYNAGNVDFAVPQEVVIPAWIVPYLIPTAGFTSPHELQARTLTLVKQ
jgi:hypothetical protein